MCCCLQLCIGHEGARRLLLCFSCYICWYLVQRAVTALSQQQEVIAGQMDHVQNACRCSDQQALFQPIEVDPTHRQMGIMQDKHVRMACWIMHNTCRTYSRRRLQILVQKRRAHAIRCTAPDTPRGLDLVLRRIKHARFLSSNILGGNWCWKLDRVP